MTGLVKNAGKRKGASSASKKAITPPSRKIADKAQFERFVEAAKKIGMDEDPEALDRAFDRIAPRKLPV